jgi:WD40 repeat protein
MPSFTRLSLTCVLALTLANCTTATPPPSTEPPPPTSTTTPITYTATRTASLAVSSKLNAAYSLDWHPLGQRLVITTGAEFVLYDVAIDQPPVWEPGPPLLNVSWLGQGGTLATVGGFRDPSISLWTWNETLESFEAGTQIKTDAAHQYVVSFSPDGQQVALLGGNSENTLQLLSVPDGALLNTFTLPYTSPLRSLDWSADSTTLLAAGKLNDILALYRLTVATGEQSPLRDLPPDTVAIALSPNETTLAIINTSGLVTLTDLATGSTLTTFTSLPDSVDLDWHPNGDLLAILSYHSSLEIWKIASSL